MPEPALTKPKATKPRTKSAPKKPPFWDKVKGLRAFYLFASLVAGGGLPIFSYNVAHTQLAGIEGGSDTWLWKALFVASIAGFIFSSLTVFDLLADWLENRIKAAAWVLVTETVMLLGTEEWASLAVLSILVVLNAGSTFWTLEKRRQRKEAERIAREKAEKAEQREAKKNARQVRSHGATNGRRKAS